MNSGKIKFKVDTKKSEITALIKKYENEPIDTLINRLITLDKDKDKDKDKLDYEHDAISIILESKIRNNYNMMGLDNYNSEYKFYPDYEDTLFNEKNYKKMEFNLNKSRKSKIDNSDPKKIDTHSKKLCNISINDDGTSRSNSSTSTSTSTSITEDVIATGPQRFKLTNSQLFLKSFLSPATPYNSMLLFHGTGVGKTCTSISIAEQYREELANLNRKIIIVLNPSIKANFLKNIFNFNRLKTNPYYQCTGDSYHKELPDYDSLLKEAERTGNYDKIEKKITKIIKNRYDFFGYQQLANYITKIENSIKESVDDKRKQTKILRNKIDRVFSNSVLIIDEAQNIKEGENGKMLPPILEKIVKYSTNMKLLLLSATPMFDNAREIIWLINLLLINDKKPQLNTNTYFDRTGNLKKEKDFLKYIQGYTSYVRGEDPYRFPKRLYPVDHSQYLTINKISIKDKNNKLIDIKDRIKNLKLIGCPMKDFQLEIYKTLDKSPDKHGAFNKPAIMCSNIAFPVNKDLVDINHTNLHRFIGDNGFTSVVNKTKTNRKVKYSIKDDATNIFSSEHLMNYSSKIASFIDIVNNMKKDDPNRGVIFIYSQFINSGVVPIALALEMNGYTKYGGSIINSDNRPQNYEHKGSYIIISGDKDLSSNSYENYMKIQEDNINGDKVRVIIGSETASEGLDFSYIRQVHILEPWFHLNKIEQVIGRGIRNCSHIGLPYNRRNVMVFMYVSTMSSNPKNDLETIDMEIYRKAELKHKQIARIEYLIKTNSVDCNININNNKFFTDEDGSIKCNYENCDYKCSPDLNSGDINQSLNTNTVEIDHSILKNNIENMKDTIKVLFEKKSKFSLEDIIEGVNKESRNNNNNTNNININTDYNQLIYYALNELISDKTTIKDKNRNRGFILYKNLLYIFVPLRFKNKLITFNDIKSRKKRHTKKNRKTKLNLSMKLKGYLDFNNNNKSGKTINMDRFKKYIEILKDPKYNHIFDYYIDIVPHIYELSFGDNDKEKKKTKNKEDYRYTMEDIQTIMETLLTKMNNTPDDLEPYEKEILNKSYNILRYRDVVRDVAKLKLKLSGPYDEIYGYRIIDPDNEKKINYFKLNKDSSKCTQITNLQDINFNIQKKIKTIEKNSIIGYLVYYKKKNSIVFKINKISDTKNTKNTKKTKLKRGSICSDKHGKKNEVLEYIDDAELTNEEQFDRGDKLYNLCMILEYIFINKQYSSDNIVETSPEIKFRKKYFFNPIESIEFGL